MSGAADTGTSKLGRYELVTQIGSGGMAEVQLAVQRGPAGFEKLVVIKLVHKNLATQKTFVDMLLDEARVAALVKHPNVVDIYDLGEVDGRYFIAMEYLEGEPLLGLLRAGRDGKRLDCLSTARLISDTAEGLDAAHELQTIGGDPIELVHHDVSLGNIMVLYNGQVKLVDFGVAKASEKAGPQMKVHGKFGYMAPEKLRGRGSDRRGDIWSLGVVLWEALTLRRLFRGSNEQDTMRMVLEHPISPPSRVNKEVSPELDAVVMKALERDPARRYARAKDLAKDIEEVLRLKAYGGRNDVIATYMQETFQAHIVARKKLLQEVVSKGRASDDVLEAAFDEAVVNTTTKRRSPQHSGEFAIAFNRRTQEGLPPGGHERRRPSSREMLAESSSVADILAARRRSEEMIAEGTPHSGVRELPRHISKQMFAEATPVQDIPDRDPEDYDRAKYPRSETQFERATTSPVADEAHRYTPTPTPAPKAGESLEGDAAVLAMVASLEPRHATPMPVVDGAEDDDTGRPHDAPREGRQPRADSVAAFLMDVVEVPSGKQLDAFGRPIEPNHWEKASPAPAAVVHAKAAEVPRRRSAEMTAQALKQITSQKLQVIKKPPTEIIRTPPAVVLEEPKSKLPLLIAAGVALVGVLVAVILFAL